MADKNRLGRFGDPIQWPEVDINGNVYERGTGSLSHIGPDQFVVLPINYVDDGTVEKLRAEAAPKPQPKQKKVDGDGSDKRE